MGRVRKHGLIAGMLVLMLLPTLGTLAVNVCGPGMGGCEAKVMCPMSKGGGHACCSHMQPQPKVSLMTLPQALPTAVAIGRAPEMCGRRLGVATVAALPGHLAPPFLPPRIVPARS